MSHQYIAALLDVSTDEIWSHLESQGYKKIKVSSLVADAVIEQLAHPEDADTQGFQVPILLSFPYRKEFAIPVNATVIKTRSRTILLSAKDALQAFFVMIDPCDDSGLESACPMIRFFAYEPTRMRSVDSYILSSVALEPGKPEKQTSSRKSR